MKNLVPWNRETMPAVCGPFGDITAFMDSVERAFGGGWPLENEGFGWTPRVEVKENEKEILISAAVPGVEKKDLRVEVQDEILTIAGEWSNGTFTRSFVLPAGTRDADIAASHKDGVLRVRLPKPEKPKGRSIEIA